MKKIIIIAVVVVVVLVGGIAAYFLLFNSDDSNEPIVYDEYEFGEMYSNIQTENKIAKFNVVIQYSGGEETLGKITSNKTELINNIYEIFRVEEFEEIQKATGQRRLREKIQQMVIETIDSDSDIISNIFFKEFIIQG